MKEDKELANPPIQTGKTRVRHETDKPTYRTVLIAASVGVLIGLLLKR
jgi:ElaB/YqjD/DUF883 family membrane-anchored ribosome-binding protein